MSAHHRDKNKKVQFFSGIRKENSEEKPTCCTEENFCKTIQVLGVANLKL